MEQQSSLSGGKLFPIFVYGTLKSGEVNAEMIPGVEREVVETAPGYYLARTGSFFPGLGEGGEETVKGELVQVTEERLRRLDSYEGHPNFFQRKPITLSDGRVVEAYFYPPSHLRGLSKVKGGVWSARKAG